jgi:rSAM/selenodomain-associated transferase 2
MFFLLLAWCLAVTLTWPRTVAARIQVVGILFFALVLRLTLLPHAADSDVNRYLWEGRLIREGLSPYSQVASAQESIGQRDPYWPGMNQKDLHTIYPPIAEWIFAVIGGVLYHPVALKAVFIVLDLASVALILAFLSARSQPLRLAGLYAFNPVPLIGFAAEGHFDPIFIFFTLLALWLYERRRFTWSWIVLSLAIQTKLVAVILVPLLARGGRWRTAGIGAAVAVLPFLPYAHDVGAWLVGVNHFGADFWFNGSVHALMSMLSGDRSIASVLCAALLILWIFVVANLEADLLRAAFFMLGGLIVFSPIVHFWYVSWALIFVPLFPSLAWIILSGSIALSFLLGQTPHLWQTLIWATFGILLTREAIRVVPALLRRRDLSEVSSLTIVVPVLNEASMLENCLHSVGRMSRWPNELIVVDGGSTDGTREIASRLGATVISTARGRGRQIAAGTCAARSDIVLVLHADSEVLPDIGSRICAALNARPDAIGGAVGQHFDPDTLGLAVIECLNEARALFFGLSFGDQGQFFRRAAVMASGGFPALPLMEDVELSLRLQAAGPTVYLGGGLVCSGRRWRRENWLKRCATVIAMTATYLLERGRGPDVAEILYQKYYEIRSEKSHA